MKKQYRIVRDHYAGYEVQYRNWLGLWRQCGRNGRGGTNTFYSISQAEAFAELHARGGAVKRFEI